jgi:nucleotide-binding universal stress UspA family protein
MLNTVLVPVDGSELGDRILSLVERLPRAGLEVVLLRVLERTPEGPHGEETYDEAYGHLYGLERRLRELGIGATHLIAIGEPAEQIVATARKVEASLVAMSTHGRGGLSRKLRGSVAEAVLQRCPVPLLLGNPLALPVVPGTGFNRVLVPLDGSTESARVIPFAELFALACCAEVILLHVAETGTAECALGAYRDRLVQDGVGRVQLRLERGDPAQAILRAQQQLGADLLALASHGLGGGSTRWFGGVADAVLRQASCPVFVLRVGVPVPARA